MQAFIPAEIASIFVKGTKLANLKDTFAQDLRKLCLAIMLELTAQKRIAGALPAFFVEFVTNNKHSSELCSDAVDSGAVPNFCSLLLEALQRLPSTHQRVLFPVKFLDKLQNEWVRNLLLQRL